MTPVHCLKKRRTRRTKWVLSHPRRHCCVGGWLVPTKQKKKTADGDEGDRRGRRPARTRGLARSAEEKNTRPHLTVTQRTLSYFTVALNPGCQSGAPWHPHMSFQNRNRQPRTQQSSPPRKKFTYTLFISIHDRYQCIIQGTYVRTHEIQSTANQNSQIMKVLKMH